MAPNKPGEGARRLNTLKEAGANLLAFSAFPQGWRAQLDFIPADAPAFRQAAKQAKWKVVGPKRGFLVQGDDRVGAIADLLERLGAAKINVTAIDAVCADEWRLPTTVDEPFRALRSRRLIREVIPLFATSTRGQPVRVAPASVAAAFMASVRESENEDLRGITMPQLSPSADLSTVEKDLRKTPGVVYAHQVPARWLLARSRRRAMPPGAGANPLLNRQWNLRAIRWFHARPLPDASAVSVGVLDTGIALIIPTLSLRHTFTSARARRTSSATVRTLPAS